MRYLLIYYGCVVLGMLLGLPVSYFFPSYWWLGGLVTLLGMMGGAGVGFFLLARMAAKE